MFVVHQYIKYTFVHLYPDQSRDLKPVLGTLCARQEWDGSLSQVTMHINSHLKAIFGVANLPNVHER